MTAGSLAAVLGAALPGCSPLVLAVRAPIDVGEYRGEGLITRIPNALNPGFAIDFEPFLLNAPLTRAYSVERLPAPRHHSPFRVALAVDLTEEEDRLWPLVPTWLTTPGLGTLDFAVVSDHGEVLLRSGADLSDLHWRRFVHDAPYGTPGFVRDACYDEWLFPSSGSNDAPRAPLRLEVRYTPGTGAVARAARLRILAGGRD